MSSNIYSKSLLLRGMILGNYVPLSRKDYIKRNGLVIHTSQLQTQLNLNMMAAVLVSIIYHRAMVSISNLSWNEMHCMRDAKCIADIITSSDRIEFF